MTFLFTDIEGSTRLLRELGSGYAEVLSEHHRTMREVWARHRGVEVDTAGDAFFVAFARASDAVAAAADAQGALAGGPVRVRMGLHTGEPLEDVGGYVGLDVHRAARIAAAGHGGQVLLSQATVELAGAEVRDLGLHRLKDLSAPERLFQLGTVAFPPLKTLHETNLPVPATPFLGRRHEVDQISALLHRPDVRLVTLTGPGGSGKTRLALQASAAAADDYEHGVWWVPLATLTDPALVETKASQALGSEDSLLAAVGDKRLLLVLDNFEHLVEAAVDVAVAIGSCPRLTVLVTSREPLHIEGEWEVAVDPLREREAVELFVQRATAVHADFAANGEVAEICRRLDCLPLAIELAAARAKLLSPSAMLERLEQRLPLLASGSRSAPERQRTLRATIAWSYELLTTAEQESFARLAVFAGGCTLEAAEEICGADIDVIGSLVDKSLVRRSGERYWMLQTIREYALELLDEDGEGNAVRRRHADHYLLLGEAVYADQFEQFDPPGAAWSRRLDVELDNLRAALDFLREHDPLGYLQLAGALGWFWATGSHFAEASQRLEEALASPSTDLRLSARALRSLANLDSLAGRPAEAQNRLEQAIELWRTLGDQPELLRTRNDLAKALYVAGDTSQALHVYEQNLALARTLGEESLVTESLLGVCQLLLATGQFERAEPLAEELQDSHYLADCAMHRRDYAFAARHYARQLDRWVSAGEVVSQTFELLGFAMAVAGLGHDEDALRLEAAIETKWEELGLAARPRVIETWRERDLGAARSRLGPSRAEAASHEGRAMPWEHAVERALDMHLDE